MGAAAAAVPSDRKMDKGKNTKKRIIGLVQLALFALYFAGVTSFPHIHEMGAEKIVHSHPFSGNHSHTDQSISAISMLSFFVAALAIAFIFRAKTFVVEAVDYAAIDYKNNPASSYKLLRAPPAVG